MLILGETMQRQRHTFFQQLQLDFVVVVAGGKTAKLECHGVPLGVVV
jgi:hypothetical protein